MIVPRTCTEIPTGEQDRLQPGERESRPLVEFRDTPAYVLVGDPGAGKTTSFEAECAALGDDACLVTARDFLTFEPQDHPEWGGKVLFIDGLDEVRAGSSDVRTAFDQVRARLDALGKPRFRLSCREADWLGENDRKHLESVSPNSQVKVLRLDPLTESEIARILDARRDIPDAEAFIEAAKERRVEGLLPNPQTLKMLADVVGGGGGGGWPQSRMQTFEMASRQMVREHNEEHQAARESGSPPAPDRLLDTAGRLCALQLISGRAGYTLRGEPEGEYPAPDQCDPDSPEALRSALSTNLFKGAASNRRTPVHRHVAEFLGGRYLAGVIQNGLPARRVISLMAGEDGVVVTELRGLSAWLAALSKEARADLIERDPIGIGLYGDIGGFSNEEKRALLESLNREGKRLGPLWQSSSAFGALAAPEMEPVLQEVLEDEDRSDDHQMFTDFILRALQEGAALPSLAEIMMKIVRDNTRWFRVNKAALHAFIHNCPDSHDRVKELRSLLADIRAKDLSDPDNELLGVLLYELWPRDLSPSEVWDCFYATRDRESFFGMYYGFYMLGLPKESSDDQVAELLDSLKERFGGLRPTAKNSSRLENLPVKLLARGLQAHGDQLATGHLYDWLDLGFTEDLHSFPVGDREDFQEIRTWLEQRPEVQKAVVLEGLAKCPESDEFRVHAVGVLSRWYGASPPSDFGLWCLQQAVSMAGERPLAAEHLLEMAFQAHRDHSGHAGQSLQLLQEQARKSPRLRERLEQLLSPSPDTEKHLQYQEEWRRQQEEEQQQWLDYVRSNKTELLENQAAPRLLYHLATLYFSGTQAIEERLRGDPVLIDAVLHGLRGVIHRKDVPDLEEILRLREQKKTHLLDLPFLASIEEAEKAAGPSELGDDRVRKAIALHYSSPLGSYKPQWYQRLLAERPEFVAQVLVQFTLSGFRSGREDTDRLSELAHDPEYAQVAKHASPPLLRAFPIRCRVTRIQDLKYLLWAALRYADRASLEDLIEEKLSYRSMTDAQRVYWLAAGVIVSPEVYGDLLKEFSEGREGRLRHLTAFFSRGSLRSVVDGLQSPALELLVRLLGGTVEPDEHWRERKGAYLTPAMKASRLVGDLIQQLAACPAKEASDALAKLLEDESLSQWHEVLSRRKDEQRVIRRDATYRHPDIEQVCQTLNGETPANAADLAALLMDRLQELALDIRRGNTDDWRQYWNEPHGQSPTPKHEDHCRDALLSDLQRGLPEGVDAQPEGQYARDMRADIRVSCRDFQVPVEIKKNMHRDLWSAPRNQLIAKYTTAPDSGGYGIYLVFWFGREGTPPPPSGPPPTGPEELSESLRAEAILTPAEARKISICVIDVSRLDN